jgi:hypothetical protein
MSIDATTNGAGSWRKKRSQVEEPKSFVVPHDTLNEGIIITEAIVGDDETRRRLLTKFQVDHFIDKENRAIWGALLEMKNRALVFNRDTLREVVGARVNYGILDVLLDAERPQNLAYHEEKLGWDRQRVAAARGPLSSLLGALQDPTEAPERVLALARGIVADLERGQPRDKAPKSPSEILRTFQEAPRALLRTGLSPLDERVRGGAGLRFGTAIALPGAPDTGKTSVAVQIADNASDGGFGVVYLAADNEGAEDIAIRLAQRRGISRDALDRGDVDARNAAADALRDCHVVIDERATVTEAASSLRVPGVIVADSLQRLAGRRMLADPKKTDNIRGAVDSVIAECTDATKQGHLVIMVSETGRGHYRAKRPEDRIDAMAAGKESGSIEFASIVQIVLSSEKGKPTALAEVTKNKAGQGRFTFRISVDRTTSIVTAEDVGLDDFFESAAASRRQAVRERVLAAVCQGGCKSASEIYRRAKGTKTEVLAIVADLERDGVIASVSGMFSITETKS